MVHVITPYSRYDNGYLSEPEPSICKTMQTSTRVGEGASDSMHPSRSKCTENDNAYGFLSGGVECEMLPIQGAQPQIASIR